MTYVMFPLATAGSGESDFRTSRLAPTLIVVVAVPVLLPVLASSGELALAEFVMTVPMGDAAFTLTVRVTVALAPLAKVGPEQATAPVPPTGGVVGQLQPALALTETNVVLAGVVSESVGVVAGSGPLLVTPIV